MFMTTNGNKNYTLYSTSTSLKCWLVSYDENSNEPKNCKMMRFLRERKL